MENLPILNLPSFEFTIKTENGKKYILDLIRKMYLALTPEEWVRQNFIAYLVQVKNFPKGLISIEKKVDVNSMNQRTDIVVYDRSANPLIIIECKSTDVKLTDKVFEQIARYNKTIKAKYLIVTNGLTHYCCKMNYKTQSWEFTTEIPDYKSISEE